MLTITLPPRAAELLSLAERDFVSAEAALSDLALGLRESARYRDECAAAALDVAQAKGLLARAYRAVADLLALADDARRTPAPF